MTREDIIDKVRAAIDELSPFGSNELNPALDLVDKTLNDSTNTVLQFLPLYLLTPTQIPGTPTPNPNDNLIGSVILPNDYIRLHSFKMSEWDTEVSQTFSPQSPVYKLQNNIYTRGGAHKPIVIVKSGASGLTLYYYSVPKGTHVMETGLYIKKDIPDNLDNSIVPFIVWQTAFDVFISIGEIEKANAAKSKLGELITLKTI